MRCLARETSISLDGVAKSEVAAHPTSLLRVSQKFQVAQSNMEQHPMCALACLGNLTILFLYQRTLKSSATDIQRSKDIAQRRRKMFNIMVAEFTCRALLLYSCRKQ